LATPISYKGDEILHVSRIVLEISILGYFCGFGATFRVFSYFWRKILHIFFLSDPDFL